MSTWELNRRSESLPPGHLKQCNVGTRSSSIWGSQVWSRLRRSSRQPNQHWVCITKEEYLRNIDLFETVSLLNVEGKVFFITVSRKTDEIPPQEQLHRPLSPEEWDSWRTRLFGAHSCSHTAHQNLSWKQRRPCCIWGFTWPTPTGLYHTSWPSSTILFLVRSRIWSWITAIISGLGSLLHQKYQTSYIRRLRKGVITRCAISVIVFVMSCHEHGVQIGWGGMQSAFNPLVKPHKKPLGGFG